MIRMMFDKLTLTGFMIVVLGWTLLFSPAPITDVLVHLSGRWLEGRGLSVPAFAQCIILSGFGMAILGALQTGFGALNKFFEAVLQRSGHGPAQPAARTIAPERSAHPRKILERGWVKNRAYVLFIDGSVEVETMLGRRLFLSLQDAQEFIA
jgi:hypothetical protein